MYQICILTDNENEQEYIKNICKTIDDELTDDDILIIDSPNISTFKSAYEAAITDQELRPIIIYPYADMSATIASIFADYPRLIVCQPIYNGFSPAPLPKLTVTSPDRILPVIATGSGEEGLSGWDIAECLQFVESSFQFDSYDIIDITDNGDGTCWVKVTGDEYKWSYFVQLYNKRIPVYIKDVSGFSNNPDGLYYPIDENYFTNGQSWVKITHAVGSGAYSGSGGKAGFNFLSGGVSIVGAKLNKIRRERTDDDYWAAIVAARATGSNPTRDNEHGYGEIDVAAAIAYDDPIPDDPHATLAVIETLDLDVDDDGVGHFDMDEVLMAKKVKLYRNDTEIYSKDMVLGEAFSYDAYPMKLGNQTYKAKAFRDNEVTNFSNNQTTNLMANINVAPVKYGTGQAGFYMDGNVIKSGVIIKLIPEVSNPDDDNEGVQINRYQITGRSLPIDENKFWVSKGALLADLKGNYLNSDGAFAGITLNLDSASNDLGGFRLSGNLSAYDFTGDIVQYVDLDPVTTMPAGQNTPQTFVDAVYGPDEPHGFVDPKTVKWITGAMLDTLL